MKNREMWRPSKYVYESGKLVASRDTKEVGVGSRLITNLVAASYDTNLRSHARGRLLDLGCGKVPLYAAYRDLVTENTCVDWGNTLHANQHLDHEVDLTKDLPFKSGEFDTIVLSDVLEHIPQPEGLCLEMARVLAGGGKVLINVPFFYWLHEEPHDYYRYTEFALRRFLDVSGLRLICLEPIGGAPEIMADILAKNLIELPRIGKLLASLTQAAALGFGRTGLGKKLTGATSRSFPFGYFLVAEKT